MADLPSHEELERWASQPLAQLQEAERRAYGVVLSTRKGQRDAPNRRQLARAKGTAAVHPAGVPDDRWSNEELQRFIEVDDMTLAAIEPPLDLDLNCLGLPDLEALADATTQEEIDQITARIQARIDNQKQRRQQPRKVKVTR